MLARKKKIQGKAVRKTAASALGSERELLHVAHQVVLPSTASQFSWV